MLRLSQKWIDRLAKQPETGTGYQVVTVVLKDGRRIERTVIVRGGQITAIHGRADVPFTEDEIADIVVTHDRWDFKTGREPGEAPRDPRLPPSMLKLDQKWADSLRRQGETGMDYQIVTVVLKDGRRIERVVVQGSSVVTGIHGRSEIPFVNDDIAEIIVTHDKWDFRTGREIDELPHA